MIETALLFKDENKKRKGGRVGKKLGKVEGVGNFVS